MGSLLRLLVLGLIMLPIVAAVMLAARVPEAQAALAAVRRGSAGADRRRRAAAPPVRPRPAYLPYPEHRIRYAGGVGPTPPAGPEPAGARRGKGRR